MYEMPNYSATDCQSITNAPLREKALVNHQLKGVSNTQHLECAI